MKNGNGSALKNRGCAIGKEGSPASAEGRRKGMCYNCGCGVPDNEMGDPRSITDKTFEEAAKAAEQTVEEAKKNTLELLKTLLKKK